MTQAGDELRMFHEFLSASGLPVLPETVESRLPPEPDITCRLVDNSEVRFELVEIVDGHFARMVSDQFRLQTHLEKASLARPVLQQQLGDALIFLGYRDGVPLRVFERDANSLLDFLEAQPDGFNADVCGALARRGRTLRQRHTRRISVSAHLGV